MFEFKNPNKYQAYSSFINASFSSKEIEFGGPNFYPGSTVYTIGVVVTCPSVQVFDDLVLAYNSLKDTFEQLSVKPEVVRTEPTEPSGPIFGIVSEYPKLTVNVKGDYIIPPFEYQYTSSVDNYVYRKNSPEINGNLVSELAGPTKPFVEGSDYVACLDFNNIDKSYTEKRPFLFTLKGYWVTYNNNKTRYIVKVPLLKSEVNIDNDLVIYVNDNEYIQLAIFGAAFVVKDDEDYSLWVDPSAETVWDGYLYLVINLRKDQIADQVKVQGNRIIPEGSPAVKLFRVSLESDEISPLATLPPSLVKEENLVKQYANALGSLKRNLNIPIGIFTTPTSEQQQKFLSTLSLNGFTAATGVQFFPLPTYPLVKNLTDEQKLAVAKQTTFNASSVYTESTGSTFSVTKTGNSFGIGNVDLSTVTFTSDDGTILYKEGTDYTLTHNGFYGVNASTVTLTSLRGDLTGKLNYRYFKPLNDKRQWSSVKLADIPALNYVASLLIEVREKTEAYSSVNSGLAKQFTEGLIAIERIMKIFADLIMQMNVIISSLQNLINAIQQLSTLNIYILYAGFPSQPLGSTEELKNLYLNAQGIPQRDDLYYAGGIAVFGAPDAGSVYANLTKQYGGTDITTRPGSSFADAYTERVLQQNPEVSTALRNLFDLLNGKTNLFSN